MKLIDKACVSVDHAVEVLNRIHDADPSVMPALIEHRVPCNLAVADDSTVQVGPVEGAEDSWEVGLLGILNGIFGTRPGRYGGYIGAQYDDHRRLKCFVNMDQDG